MQLGWGTEGAGIVISARGDVISKAGEGLA